MQQTIDLFHETVDKTMEILKEVEWELKIPERRQAYHVFQVVLHAIRDRLPVIEAVELAANFPLFTKAVYYEGWSPTDLPMRLNEKEFIDKIDNELEMGLITPEEAIYAVLVALKKFIPPDKMEDIKTIWPCLNEFFEDNQSTSILN